MSTSSERGVKITGLEVPFWDLVVILVKLSIAAIPAMIILLVSYAALMAVVLSVFGRA